MNTQESIGRFQTLEVEHKGQLIKLRGYNPYFKDSPDPKWIQEWEIVRPTGPNQYSLQHLLGPFNASEMELLKDIAADYFSWGQIDSHNDPEVSNPNL